MSNAIDLGFIRRGSARAFASVSHALLFNSCLFVLVVPPTLLRAVGAPAQVSAGTSEVGVSQSMEASDGQLRFARTVHAELSEEVAGRGFSPAAEVQLERVNDRVSVATSTAAAPMAQRLGSAYAQVRSVYAADDGRHEIARTDLVASYEGDLVTIELVTLFAGNFDRQSRKDTRMAGTEIRRTIEVEAPGLQEVLDSSGTDPDPDRLAEIRDRLEAAAGDAAQMVTVTNPDGSSVTYAADDPDLAEAVGRGAGADCAGRCFSDNGFAIGAAEIACIVAGLVGCGIACVLTAGIACAPCIGGVIAACGIVVTAGGIIGCIIDCAFGGGPPQPTPTPNLSSCPQSSLANYYTCAAELSCGAVNNVLAPTHPARGCFSSAVASVVRSVSCRTSRPYRPTTCTLSNAGLSSLGTTLMTCLTDRFGAVQAAVFAATTFADQCALALAQRDAARAIAPTFTPTPTPTFTPKPTQTPTPSSCLGDCNADGQVTVDELLIGLDMALGSFEDPSCGAFDRNRDNGVSIDEVVGAVGSALTGCQFVARRSELLVTSTGSDRVLIYDLEDGNHIDTLRVDDAGFSQPRGVAVAADGRVYVGVTGSAIEDAVVRFDREIGSIDTFVSPNSGRVIRPEGLAFGPEGDLYVSSRNLGRVQTFDGANGDFIQSTASLFEPRGLTFGPADGLLYVISGNEVRRFDRTSRVDLGAFVAAGAGDLRTDTGSAGLAFGPDGHLYVSSVSTDTVLRYDGRTGAFIDEFVSAGSGGLDQPVGLAFAPDGRLYVASGSTDNVLRYDGRTGTFIDEFVASGNGGLSRPTYLTVTSRSE
jgi:WD40 repeat protein